MSPLANAPVSSVMNSNEPPSPLLTLVANVAYGRHQVARAMGFLSDRPTRCGRLQITDDQLPALIARCRQKRFSFHVAPETHPENHKLWLPGIRHHGIDAGQEAAFTQMLRENAWIYYAKGAPWAPHAACWGKITHQAFLSLEDTLINNDSLPRINFEMM